MATLVGRSIFYSQKSKFILLANSVPKLNIRRTLYPVRYYSVVIKSSSVHCCHRTAFLKRCSSAGLVFSRHLSGGDAGITESYIPAPPIVPSLDEATVSTLTQVEPSFASQGLGGWTPVGLIEQLLEFIHVSVGLPWWVSISVATIMARTLLLPVFVIAQRNAAKLHNIMPQMQILQMKITEARQNGNAMEAAKYTNELARFIKEKDCNPLKSMFMPLVQAPVFISFFFGLRNMANLPVESLKTGGTFWFSDLTVADPFYALPLITCVTLFITLEIGAEGGMQMNSMQVARTARYLFRAIPVFVFPFIMNFPAALLCYWVNTNAITLLLVALLKVPGVKPFFKIPEKQRHSPDSLPPKKGFKESFRETVDNMKMAREMEGRVQADQMKFRKAGMGPIPKTYKFDPTKQKDKI